MPSAQVVGLEKPAEGEEEVEEACRGFSRVLEVLIAQSVIAGCSPIRQLAE